jgi:hypothetical protein
MGTLGTLGNLKGELQVKGTVGNLEGELKGTSNGNLGNFWKPRMGTVGNLMERLETSGNQIY